MASNPIWAWLEGSALGSAVRESAWLYPAVETLHILGLALLFGAIVLLDLRLLGAARAISIGALARYVLPIVYVAFGVQITTGFLLFASDAATLAANAALRVKLVLVALAVLNALAFNLGPFRALRATSADETPSATSRVFAVASILLWVGVVVCGRLIAYV
jgi:hypothetical protein